MRVQFCMLHLSLQAGLIVPITFSTLLIFFSTSIQHGNGYRSIAKKPISGEVVPLAIPSYLSGRSTPFTQAGIHPCYFPPGAVSYSSHRNEYARWKDCNLVKSCALLCMLNLSVKITAQRTARIHWLLRMQLKETQQQQENF